MLVRARRADRRRADPRGRRGLRTWIRPDPVWCSVETSRGRRDPGARRGGPDRRLPPSARGADRAHPTASRRSWSWTVAPTGPARAARHAAEALGLKLHSIEGPAAGAGAARRTGMDAAAGRLFELGLDHGLIACTDADSRPAPDWLARQLDHVAAGAVAIAGLIELDDERQLAPGVLRQRRRDAEARLARVRELDPDAAHHHFAGASMAVTAGRVPRRRRPGAARGARGRRLRDAPARAPDPGDARRGRSRADLGAPRGQGSRAASRSTSPFRRGRSAAATTLPTSPSPV